MKRVLLQENSKLLIEISSDLKQYLPLLKKVQNSYESLELLDFNDEVLKEIVLSGTKGIEAKFIENLEIQIKKLEVKNSVFKENLMNGSKPLLLKFTDSVKELKRFRPDTYSRLNYLKLNFISFKNNEFYLSDENKEQILENECRIYLENEKQKDLHENLLNFVEAYSKLSETLNELQFSFSYNQGKGLNAIENTFLEFRDNKYSIVAGSIKYATNFNENRLKYN